MGRPSRFELLARAKEQIVATLKEETSHSFTEETLRALLEEHRERWGLAQATTGQNFLEFLVNNDVLQPLAIRVNPRSYIYRYLYDFPHPYAVALSLTRNSYLSHYSAFDVHGLTDDIPKSIYVNKEQTSTGQQNFEGVLEQKKIDFAFAKEMRRTTNAVQFEYNHQNFRVFNLSGRYTSKLGVASVTLGAGVGEVTDLERTLIDATVRPDYVGGIANVFTAFERSRSELSIERLVEYLRKLNFVYPYHQSVGFYLSRAGIGNDKLRRLKTMRTELQFYLAYKMANKKLDTEWNIYYPETLFS